jgi:hypothetical protein
MQVNMALRAFLCWLLRFSAMFELLQREILLTLLGAKDWSAFAYAYIGNYCRVNGYDDKLREQYFKFAA